MVVFACDLVTCVLPRYKNKSWFTGSGCVHHCKVMSRISQLMLTSYVSVYVCSGQLVKITIISKAQILEKSSALYKEHDGSGKLVDVHVQKANKKSKHIH